MRNANTIAVTTAPVTRGSAAEIVYATGPIEPERWARMVGKKDRDAQVRRITRA
jgi:hypothetical protein